MLPASLALLSGAALSADFYLVVPMKGRLTAPQDITVALNAYTLPDGTVGTSYNFDFKNLLSVTGDSQANPNQATFSLTAGALPAGLSLATDGVLTGTPTQKNVEGSGFQLLASYKTKTGEQIYNIVVNGAVLQVKALAAGHRHACALTLSNGVKCWGDNYYGQVGDNTTTERHAPVDVYGLSSGVAAITAGGAHTCALLSDGGVKCWGYNALGQLGNNSTVASSVPTAVSGLSTGVAAVRAGGTHTCALTSAGGLKCWGEGTDGRLGMGDTATRMVPADVPGLTSGVSMVSTGVNNTCVVTSAGGVKCWGLGTIGQLGNGGLSSSSTPVDVAGLTTGSRRVSVGGWFVCAETTSNGVKCWGVNTTGQLGNNTYNNSSVPVDVVGLANVSSVATGVSESCAVTAAGAVKCWGRNGYGQLGNNSTNDSPVPVDVKGLSSGATAVTLGSGYACAVVNGGAKCWGYNNFGELGLNTTTSMSTPQGVQP